jgi:ABC-type dipeptide/oligopeptide/nickel transport system permease component
MAVYIFKRLFLLIPLLFGITLLVFALTDALPGDPVQGLVGERAKPEVIESIRKEIGADKSFPERFIGYLRLLARGEMGRSYYTNRKVSDDLILKFPNTVRLAVAAMLIAAPLGLLLGFAAALKRDSLLDRIITSTTVLGVSLPVFWSGLLLMLLISLNLRLLPPSGTGGLRFLLLPALTLSLPALSALARVARTSIIEILDMPFIGTARAKGISPIKINLMHVLKNALIPFITVVGLDFGSYLNGAVLTETIFGWDGVGRFLMEGIIKRDYPVVMGSIILATVVVIGINLLVDILYHLLDPRVRLYAEKR